MPALGRLAGDLELEFAGFGRARYVLDVVALWGERLAGFGRAVGVLDFGVVLAVGRFAGFGRARGGVDLGDGREAVGCSRVCRGRAILR